MYNATTKPGLKKLAPSMDWNAYFKQLGFEPGKRVVLTTPPYVKAVDKLRKQFKPAQWQAYFTYHVLHDLAFALPKKLDDEAFALQKAISGVQQQRARYKRCIDAVDGAMPEYLGQPYVKRAFPGESKAAATQMIDAIVTSLGEDIDALSWMS